jgi:hypothetical protein
MLFDFPERFIRPERFSDVLNHALICSGIKPRPALLTELPPLALEPANIQLRHLPQQHLVNRWMQALHPLMLVLPGADKANLEVAADELGGHAMRKIKIMLLARSDYG